MFLNESDKLKQKLIYSFFYDFRETRVIVDDYLDSGAQENYLEFFLDTKKNDVPSLEKRIILIIKHMLIPMLQLIIAFLSFREKSLFYALSGIIAFIFLDAIVFLRFYKINSVLKLNNKVNTLNLSIMSVVLLIFVSLLSSDIILRMYFIGENMGKFLQYFHATVLTSLLLIKFWLNFERYKKNKMFFSMSLSPAIFLVFALKIISEFSTNSDYSLVVISANILSYLLAILVIIGISMCKKVSK